MQDGGVIFFDLTQLVLRVVDPTPDGIGRVELAYARHLLAHYPRKVRFLLALPQLVQVIPTSVAARYIKPNFRTFLENMIPQQCVSGRAGV